MNISLTRDEYKSLIEMMYIADWVMNSHTAVGDHSLDRYTQLEQKIYSLADRMGCRDLVEYSEVLKTYFPTSQMDDGPAMQYVDDYDNDTFWEELLERLVQRDMVRQFGAKRLGQMPQEDRWAAEDPVREKYAAEFEKNGIDRVEVMTLLTG